MNSKKIWINSIFVSVFLWVFNIGGCSTQTVSPPAPPIIPEYMRLPHPQGMDRSDLALLFNDVLAPTDPDFLKTCDKDFKKLLSLTLSQYELIQGERELVKNDPVRYHWCFYAKLLHLETVVRSDSFVDERQKELLDAFEYLVPVARNFSSLFSDSRYLRWAVDRYRRFSELIFYRKLDLTPNGSLELVQPINPFGLYRDSQKDNSILDKYHLVEPGVPTVKPLPKAEPTVGPTGEPLEPFYVPPTPAPVPSFFALPNTAVPNIPTPPSKPSPVPAPGSEAGPLVPLPAPKGVDIQQ
jgi:hypothetical protein